MGKATNVAVAVRVRPLSDQEANQNGRPVVTVNGNSLWLKGFDRSFTFDHCFPHHSEPADGTEALQEEVYEAIGKSLTLHSLQGFNTCILAYGQTGSGKTHTMMGSRQSTQDGIIPRLCDDLFKQLTEQRTRGDTTKVKCEMSFFEIYNEKVNCLLSEDDRERLKVREHPVTGPYVEGLTKRVVTTFNDVHQLITQGNNSRTVAETRYNQHSSRSHAVFTLIITQTTVDVDSGQCIDRVSRVNLVDLAGSERLGSSTTTTPSEVLKDGININKSLSTLGRVIHALSERPDKSGSGSRSSLGEASASTWVAYRDSVLTWLLKENLGGNSKTVMLACISPSETQFEETLNTLRYADRVKRIKNNAVVNEDQNSKLIRDLYGEIRRLRTKLEERGVSHSPQRRASYTEAVRTGDGSATAQDWAAEYWSTLDSSEEMISELNAHWERKLEQSREVYQSELARVKNTSMQQLQSPRVQQSTAPGCPVAESPLLVSLDPHLIPGEFVSWCILEGDTVVTTAQEPNEDDDETRTIRLADGLNLCDPHCLINREGDVVTLFPGMGSITFVDGQLLTSTVQLSHASRIIFGSSHTFYFLDPKEAKKLRDARTTKERVPKVLDWAYASEEFAQVMECYKPYEDVIKLQDEVEYWRSLSSEGSSNVDACAACCLLLVSEPKYYPYVTKPGLVYPLQEGNNKISAETWGLRDLGDPFYIEVIRGQLYKRNKEGGAAQQLWHGMKIACGQSVLIVNCPCSPLEPEVGERGSVSQKGMHSPRKPSPRPVKARQIVFKEEEAESLVHGMMGFQYQLLAMHDVLYSVPAELSETPIEELQGTQPEEVITILEFKKSLKDFTLLETPIKHLSPIHFKEILSRMTQSLRELTHQFTHRLDYSPPSPVRGARTSVATSHTEDRSPRRERERERTHRDRERDRGRTHDDDRSVNRDCEDVGNRALLDEMRTKQHLLSQLETVAKAREAELSTMKEKVQAWQQRTRRTEDEMQVINEDNRQLKRRLQHMQELQEKATGGEIERNGRVKLLEAELEAMRVEGKDMRAENDRLLGVLQHLREEGGDAAAEVVRLRQQIGELEQQGAEAAAQVDVLRAENASLSQAAAQAAAAASAAPVAVTVAPTSRAKLSVEQELQETISVLSESSKKDKKIIKKLQQQLAEQNLTLRTLQAYQPTSPRLVGDQPTSAPTTPPKRLTQHNMPQPEAAASLEGLMHHLRALVLPLGLAILPLVERIANDVQARGSIILHKAWQAAQKALGQLGEAGELPASVDRSSAARALREIVIYFETTPQVTGTCEQIYGEILGKGKAVIRLGSLLRGQGFSQEREPGRHRDPSSGRIRSMSPRDMGLVGSGGPNAVSGSANGGIYARVLSGTESSISRDSPIKRRQARGMSPSRFGVTSPHERTSRERRHRSSSNQRPSSGPGIVPGRKPSPVGPRHNVAIGGTVKRGPTRASSRSKQPPPPSIDLPAGGGNVPATTTSLRSSESQQSRRSDSATRRQQLAARIFQR